LVVTGRPRSAAPRACALAALAVAALGGCVTVPAEAPAPATESIALLYARPAERALVNGLRAYEEGAFERAEQSFRTAVLQSLRDPRDAAVAHKYLAFIACAFNRIGECEQQFKRAFGADPRFLLTDAEIGHPIWGPVYRQVAQARADEALAKQSPPAEPAPK
jgi:Tfp pilus assembly protein PilF